MLACAGCHSAPGHPARGHWATAGQLQEELSSDRLHLLATWPVHEGRRMRVPPPAGSGWDGSWEEGRGGMGSWSWWLNLVGINLRAKNLPEPDALLTSNETIVTYRLSSPCAGHGKDACVPKLYQVWRVQGHWLPV